MEFKGLDATIGSLTCFHPSPEKNEEEMRFLVIYEIEDVLPLIGSGA